MARPARPSIPEVTDTYLLGGVAVTLFGLAGGILYPGVRLAALVGVPLLLLLLWTGRRLQRSEATAGRLTDAMDRVSKGVLITDSRQPGYPVVSLNSAFTRITKYDSKSILGRTSQLLEGVETEQHAKKEIATALQEGRSCRARITLHRKDGSPFLSELTISPVRDQTGTLTLSVWEIEESSDALQQPTPAVGSGRRHGLSQPFFDLLPDPLLVLSPDGAIDFSNAGAQRLLGYDGQELAGRSFASLLLPIHRDRYEQAAAALADQGSPGEQWTTEEITARRKDQTLLSLELSMCPLDHEGAQTRLVLLRDLSDSKRAEERMAVIRDSAALLSARGASGADAARLLQNLCEHLGWDVGALWRVDRDAEVLRCMEFWQAPSAQPVLEAEKAKGRTCTRGQGLPGRVWSKGEPEWADALDESRAGGPAWSRRDARTGGGLGFPIVSDGTVLGVFEFYGSTLQGPDSALLVTLTAVAGQFGGVLLRQEAEEEAQRLESALRQSQKGELISNLAGGIAHDLNNTLTAILGFTELTFPAIPSASRAATHLKQIMKAGDRAKDLVQQVLSFTRQGEHERAPVQLHLLIDEALKLVRPTLPSTIEVRVNLSAQSGTVLADPIQVQQLLTNLCTNAEHAMRESGGILEITLERVVVTQDLAQADPALMPGAYARLSVKDSGHGMPGKVKKHMFDPLFTTKAPDEGAGMGLAVVKGIVTRHGGAILVESVPQRGTRVDVYFPLLESGSPHEPGYGQRADSSLQGGSERILLVEDEEPLAELAREMLESLGYQIVVRTDPRQALEAFRTAPDCFDLVITDQTMPHATGDTLAREMLRIRPGLPVILVTGYSHTTDAKKAQAMGVRLYLRKPLVLKELAMSIRQVLDEHGGDHGANGNGSPSGERTCESLTQTL